MASVRNLICRLGAMALCAALAMPVAAQGFDQITGGPGRVVIVDASGSMRAADYVARPRQRMDRAKGLFALFANRLAEGADPLPTAVHVFGDTMRWSDVQAQYRSSSDYPYTGALCQDIRQVAAFSRLDRGSVRQMVAAVGGLDPRGMTPVHVAISRALSVLDARHGGEIVLISDLDVVNCLPPGMTLCEALQPDLRRFDNATMSVTVKVFETPSANVKDELQKCLNVQSFVYPVTMPDPGPPVDDALRKTAITITPRYARPPEVAPDALDASQITLQMVLRGGTGVAAYTGPPSRIGLPPGTYDLIADVAGRPASLPGLRVTADDRQDLPVDPADIRFAMTDAGAPLMQPAVLTITPVGASAPLSPAWTITDGQSLRFGTGQFDLAAELPDGRRAVTRISTRLGTPDVARLDFAGAQQAGGRPVIFDLRRYEPTLSAAMQAVGLSAAFAPQVEVPGRGVVPGGGGTLTLPPGAHQLRINGAVTLDFDVAQAAPGAAPVRVAVELVPGWFSARRDRPGILRLTHAATGTLIGEFHDPQVTHSLPDGDYTLDLLDDNRNRLDGRSFSAAAGTVADIRF